MKSKVYLWLFLLVTFAACKKENKKPVATIPTITSPEYIDNLLFVSSNNYQIRTSDSATFSSTDPNIKMSNSGYITNLTSGEIVKIIVTWKNGATPSTIYALGSTDIDQLEPAAYFHGETATDPYNDYVEGWKLLEKLPIANENYTLVLRHADASFGRDWPLIHTGTPPDNWWMSQDSLLARQLNTQGFARATDLGQIVKDLNYPIARVFTSEFYRARQTATLMNLGIQAQVDGRINHLTHNTYAPGIFDGVMAIISAQPLDGQMNLIITHHPGNEPPNTRGVFISYPTVSVFNWSGSYIIKTDKDSVATYEGGVTYAMLKYWRDLKLKKLQ